METLITCPRGHPVEDEAVLCTVCWVRLDGEDPENKRARALNLVSRPVVAAVVGAVVLAAGVGAAIILANPSAPPGVIAGESAVVIAPPSPSESAEEPSAVEQPIVTSVPLAATVVSPAATGADSPCLLNVLDQEAACRTEGDLVRFEVCVAAETSTVEIRTRPSADDKWADVSSDVVFLPGDGCAAGGQRADVALAAASFDVTESKWRLVGRDSTGDKLWKSKLRPAAAGE
jgi:hypothetical protein